METIRNIFCIGRNYVAHANELGNDVPTKPLIFTKPTNALATANGEMLHFPGDKGEIHYEAELVLKMGTDYDPNLTVDEMVNEMTIGLDLTFRDIQSELKAKGHPWLVAKGFPNAAIVGDFIPFPGEAICKTLQYTLAINDIIVQTGDSNKMIFPFAEQIHYIGRNIGLKKDDIIFTGTPEGVGPLEDGDKLVLKWHTTTLGTCHIGILAR